MEIESYTWLISRMHCATFTIVYMGLSRQQLSVSVTKSSTTITSFKAHLKTELFSPAFVHAQFVSVSAASAHLHHLCGMTFRLN